MLTLRDLKKLKDEGTIKVMVDFEDPDDEDAVFVSITTDWEPTLALADVEKRDFLFGHISLDEQLVRLSDGRSFKLNELFLYVHVEGTYKRRRGYKGKSSKRERQARREWEKIKQQLKKCGFVHIQGQPEWFNTWENGKWKNQSSDEEVGK